LKTSNEATRAELAAKDPTCGAFADPVRRLEEGQASLLRQTEEELEEARESVRNAKRMRPRCRDEAVREASAAASLVAECPELSELEAELAGVTREVEYLRKGTLT
jgi:hypothetical protein